MMRKENPTRGGEGKVSVSASFLDFIRCFNGSSWTQIQLRVVGNMAQGSFSISGGPQRIYMELSNGNSSLTGGTLDFIWTGATLSYVCNSVSIV